MIKVFVVVPRLCFGGAERVGVMLANGLARRGMRVVVVTNLFDQQTYSVDDGVVLRNLFSNAHPNKYLKWFSAVKQIRRYIKEEQPDVILGIMWMCSLLARLATIGTKIPVVSTVHDAFEHPACAKMSLLERFHKFQLNKLYDYVTVLTNSDKKVIGNRLKNISVFPNPLALVPLSNPQVKEKVILAAGRLEDWHYKGFDLLIKAWGRIAKKYKGWTLQIAGVGTDEQRLFLQDMASNNHIEPSQFQLLGFRADIEELYRKSEIFVLSSRYEGFGLVLIEAMSQGCACLSTDYKGRQSEIILNEREGITCRPESVDELAAGLERLLSDDCLRKDIQTNAIEGSKRFGVEVIVAKWDVFIRNIVAKHRK